VPFGTYFIRHFGGQAGIAKWQVSSHQYALFHLNHYLRFPLQTTITLSANNCASLYCTLLEATVIQRRIYFVKLNFPRCVYMWVMAIGFHARRFGEKPFVIKARQSMVRLSGWPSCAQSTLFPSLHRRRRYCIHRRGPSNNLAGYRTGCLKIQVAIIYS
jgi:hypothetical protein